jgi:hypothetical protein
MTLKSRVEFSNIRLFFDLQRPLTLTPHSAARKAKRQARPQEPERREAAAENQETPPANAAHFFTSSVLSIPWGA